MRDGEVLLLEHPGETLVLYAGRIPPSRYLVALTADRLRTVLARMVADPALTDQVRRFMGRHDGFGRDRDRLTTAPLVESVVGVADAGRFEGLSIDRMTLFLRQSPSALVTKATEFVRDAGRAAASEGTQGPGPVGGARGKEARVSDAAIRSWTFPERFNAVWRRAAQRLAPALRKQMEGHALNPNRYGRLVGQFEVMVDAQAVAGGAVVDGATMAGLILEALVRQAPMTAAWTGLFHGADLLTDCLVRLRAAATDDDITRAATVFAQAYEILGLEMIERVVAFNALRAKLSVRRVTPLNAPPANRPAPGKAKPLVEEGASPASPAPKGPSKAPPAKAPPTSPATKDDLIAKSPTLKAQLDKLAKDGWTIKDGDAGKGSYCSKSKKEIVIDSNRKSDPEKYVRTLSHEVGHALHKNPNDTSSKKAFVDGFLEDEGAATINNIKVQREIVSNGGPDIGISGNPANAPAYNKAYDQSLKNKDEGAARREVGSVFADGEKTSTTKQTYREYYSSEYDKNYGSKGSSSGGSSGSGSGGSKP